MLESVVERLLSRYLAQYVRGISRDKLSVAVWSGNVELEDLQVKPEVSDILGIPFRVVWGRVQKIKLTIPWSRLGTAPVCVEVAGLHVLLHPKPIPEQSDEELIQQLRQAKRRQVEACELQMHDARLRLAEQQHQHAAAGSSSSSKEGDGGFFFRFVNKILSNLLVDIRDVHVALVDPARGFSVGVLLNQASIHNTDAAWRRHEPQQQQKHQAFYKACELSGLAIYCALDGGNAQQPKQLHRTRQQQKQQEHPFPQQPKALHAALPLPTFPPPPPSEPPPLPSCPAPCGYRTAAAAAPSAALAPSGEEGKQGGVCTPPIAVPPSAGQGNEGSEEAVERQLLACEAPPCPSIGPTVFFGAAGGPEGGGTLAQTCEGPSGEAFANRLQPVDARRTSRSAAGSAAVTAGAASNGGRASGGEARGGLTTGCGGGAVVSFAWPRSESGGATGTRSQYVLKPLHLRLTLLHAPEQQELEARLEVLRESQGIEISRSHLEALLAISNEAAQRRQRCEQLLLRQAHTVMLGTEGLEGKTQREFIGLYSRQLQAEAGVRGVAPLTYKEQQRLLTLHDVVGVRHLAKWRNICTEATNRVLQQTQLLQQQQQQQLLQQQRQLPRQQQQSWWQWVTGRQTPQQQQQQQQQQQEMPKAAEGAQTIAVGDTEAPLLTSEDIQLIVDAVQSDELMQSVSLPTKYVLTFELEQFSVCLKNDNEAQEVAEEETADVLREAKSIKAIGYSPKEASKCFPPDFPQPPPPLKLATAVAAADPGAVTAPSATASIRTGASDSLRTDTSAEKAFLSVELFNLCAALDLLNRQDAAGRDSSEWSFCISLSNVAVRQQSHLLMHFRRENAAAPAAPVAPAAAAVLAAAESPRLSSHCRGLMMFGGAVSGENELSLATSCSRSSSSSGSSSSSSSSSSSWRCSSGSSSSWSFSRSSTSAVAFSPAEATASCLTAARLELRHDLTPTGNILGVYIRLSPLVAAIKPELVRTLCDFFVFETPADVRRLEEEEERRAAGVAAPAAAGSHWAPCGAGDDGKPDGVDSSGSSTSKVATEVGDMRKSEFVEGLRETGETVYEAAVQHLPDLVQLDLLVAAPILNLDGKGAGSVALHLGTLSLRSDGACPYDALRGVLEVNETRLICAPTGHQEVSILRPIPIRVQLEVFKMKDVRLNILFEEIFLELTPEAIGLLIAVPASMAKSLLQERPQQVTTDRQQSQAPTTAATAEQSGRTATRTPTPQHLDPLQDAGGQGEAAGEPAVGFSATKPLGTLPAAAAEAAEAANAATEPPDPVPAHLLLDAVVTGSGVQPDDFCSNDDAAESEAVGGSTIPCGSSSRNISSNTIVDTEERSQLVFASIWRFGRCGFLVRGLADRDKGSTVGGETGPPVLQAELTDLQMQLTADLATGKCGAAAELHQVLVSDPSTDSPLFLSLQNNVELATSRSTVSFGRSGSVPLRSTTTLGGAPEEEEFHDAVEDMEKSLRVELEVLLGKYNATTVTSTSATASPTPAASAAATTGADGAAAGAAAAEACVAAPKATLVVTSLPVELHWRQQSLRRILQTLEVYRETIRGRVQLHLDELSEASAAALGPRGLLSKETVAAVHDTLQTVQQTLSFRADGECMQGGAAADAQRSSSTKSRSKSGNAQALRRTTTGRDWLRTGLDLGSVLPPLAIHRCCDTAWKVSQDGTADRAAATAPTAGAGGAAGGGAAEEADAAGIAGESQEQLLQPTVQRQVPHVGLELTLTFREVAVAFWETNEVVLARMALKELKAFSRFYSNGDTETTFAIGDGGVVFRDRCVLAPRAAYRPPSQQQPRRHTSAAAHDTAKMEGGASYPLKGCDIAAAPEAPGAAPTAASSPGITGAVSGTQRTGKGAPAVSLFTARLRQYGGPDPISAALPPYSMCLEGQMEQICFVYRQQDVSRTLNYLRDGIFDVFISKSYRAVKEAATASYCLFALDIQSPLFILAEDKDAIPGYVAPPGYRMPNRLSRVQKQSAAPAAATPTACPAPTSATDPLQMEVEVGHLGRFIVFDLGNLKMHNAYMPAVPRHHPHQEQEHQEQPQHEFIASRLLHPPSFGDAAFASVLSEETRLQAADDFGGYRAEGAHGEVICSDLRLEMRGMQISASDNTQEPAAGGCLLENVEARMLLRSAPTSLSIEAETTAWLLHLSRQQLTLVFDVINENIGGQGYAPASEVPPVPPAAAAAATDSSSSGGGGGGCLDDAALRRELEAPPLAVECHIVIPQLTLEASYGAEAPLALLSLHRITAKAAVSVSRLVSCYRFLLYAEEFSIDDLRASSANYFKRVAHCTAPGGGDSRRVGDRHCCGEVGENLPGGSQGEEESDASEFVDTLQRRSKVPGVQFEFGSSLRESYMDFQFSGVTVYLLLVAFMDILSYFTSSWAFSSMRSYPKPLPTLLKNAEQQHQDQQQLTEGERVSWEASRADKVCDSTRGNVMSVLLSGEALRERPFRVSVIIRRGCFVVYSALQSALAPIIVWSSDFLVHLIMKGDEIAFERVKVTGSKICRFNSAPPPEAPLRSQSHAGVFTSRHINTGECSVEDLPGHAASSVVATQKHGIAREGSAAARTVRWGSTDVSSNISSEASSNRQACRLEFSCSPRDMRQHREETAAGTDWKQQERHMPQQMMRDWAHMQQLQQLHHFVSGRGPSPERLAPRTDPSSAVLLCEQFHLEGRGVYRSACVAPEDRSESSQQQQQGQAQGNDQAATTPHSHDRIPAAVHRMQQAFSAAAAKLPPSSISPRGGRRAPPLSSGSAAAAPKQPQQPQPQQQQREVGTDGPQKPDDQRRLKQKQRGKQAPTRSALQQQCTPMEQEQMGASAQPRVATFIDMSFDIPLFFLRVSCRDMALLLAAAQGLHSDGPSVCPPQQPPPICLPEACARRQQRQQQEQKQEDADIRVSQQLPPLVERTAKISLCLDGAQLLLLDDLRSSVLPVLQLRLSAGGLIFDIMSSQLQVALRDFSCGLDYLNAKAGCWEPFIEKLDITAVYRRDYAEEKQQLLQRQQAQVGALELLPGEDPWGSFKAAKTLMLHSQSPFWLNCTPQLCDLFAWFLPYLLAHLTEGGVPTPDSKGCVVREGPRKGCLSPSTVARDSLAAPSGPIPSTLQLLEGDTEQDDDAPEPQQDLLVRLGRSCSEGQGASSAAGAAPATTTAAAVASMGREVEAAFRYLNLTGECHYAFTMHKVGGRNRGVMKEQSSRSSNPSNSSGKGCGLSSSRIALRGGAGGGRGERSEIQTVDGLLLLLPGSSSPLPLDGLLQSRTAEASRRSRNRQRFYITNCPPVESVLQLREMFPSVSVPAICRSIMSTQDVQHTLRFLTTNEEMRRKIRVRNLASASVGLHRVSRSSSPSRSSANTAAAILVGPTDAQQQQNKDADLSQSPRAVAAPPLSPRRLSEGCIDPSPPAIGPFPRGTKAVAVDSMRNCCVTLLPPVRHSLPNPKYSTAPAAVAALRGPTGTANAVATTTERFLGGSSKGVSSNTTTVSSSSSSNNNKFAARQLQRLRSSLTMKDRRPSGAPLAPQLSHASTITSANITTAGALEKRELWKQRQEEQQEQQHQQQQQQGTANPTDVPPQEARRHPTALGIAALGGGSERSFRSMPLSGQSIFVDLELWRARGSRGESLQQLSGEHSTISSSFSAPLPLAHVDSTSEAICQVLSPHPSYKLLLLSTTVSVHNSSGMPLEICFLDAELNPLLLPAAHGAYAPLEAIGEAPPCACKRGHLSMEEPSSLHPDLLRVPEWMLLREERWKLVQRRETLQHKEQLKLLQQASAAKSPSLRRTAAAPFRRSLTESGRITGYTKSPTSHGSLQHEKSARDGDLSSESHTRQPAERLTYTFLLPNQHVLSVPQRAILGSGWCNVCFRPAAFAEETAAATEAASTAGANPVGDPPECANSDAEAELIPAPPDMTCVAGWCDMIDTRHRMKGLRCRQSSYLPPDCRPGASVGAAAGATGADGGGVKTVRNLYFLVHIEGRKGALPAEKELKRVTIFPSLTLVNATPTELEVCIAPSSSSSKASRRQLNATPTSSRTAEAALQELHALQQRPILNATLRRRSTFLVYAVPPNRPLRFRMRFAMLEGAEWSSTVSDLLSSQDEVVTRVLVPSRHNASVELEVLHDTAEVIPFLPYVSPRQLVAVIAAPRAFIDRTGLGVRPIQDGRFFPEFDGQSLLGDSATSDVTLLLPRRRGLGQPVECRVSVPALGGYSHATLEAEDRCYTLRLRSEKMDPSETAGAICRVVSLVPEFILTNALKVPLFFRQYGTPGPAFEVHPGQSYPVYWANSELPQAIQFRPGAGDGYAWSGAVVASEETAGKSWIALYNGMRDAAPGVFCVEVAPDGGVKSICIRGVEGNSEGFLVINRCPVIQRVMVHTYHTEMSVQGQSTDIGGGPSSFPPSSSNWSRHPLKLPDFDFHFFANEGETVAYGWPFPFTYTSRPCQVLLWIDSKTVAPKSPIALDLETPQYKRYEVNLGLPDMPQIIVRTEKRGDAMIIEVRPKPGTGPEGTLAVMPSTRPHGAEHEMAAETPLRSLHVAVTMAQVGISLIYDAVREELCFAEMSQLAIGFQERGERQKLLVRIADIQIDNQMERARKPVLLANRGGGGHGAEESSTHNASKPFLSLFVVRHHTTSSDVILRRVQLEVDNLEVEIDADALNGLNDFFWACMTSLGLMSAASRRTISAEDMDVWIESPIHQTFDVYCWCSFVLDKLHMLSDLLKVGLRILMASGRLELMGAKLNFQREEFRNLRGTAKTFVASLQERYTYHLLNSVFSSLGQSSLLNLPRMPFELGKNTIGLAANAVDSVSAGLGSLLSTFTFDSEYINRRQRERGRNTASMRDGFLSAGKNIGEGMWSLTNIVTKPIEGAQREGVGGFFKGIGKGIVGSLVKPLDKVGQAVSDVTRGIKAEVSRPIGAYKFRNERRRKPRMLGELGEIRPYDETEATLRECLGLAVTRRLQKFVTVLKEEALPPRHFVVLFYPKDLFFVDLAGSSQASGGPQVGDESEAGAAKNVNVLWHASIPLVRDIRASTHGVIIRAGQPAVQRPKEVLAALSSLDSSPRSQGTHGGSLRHVEARGDHCYQIPCPSAALISQLYKELLEAVHGSTSVVQLGTWDAERYTETDDDS